MKVLLSALIILAGCSMPPYAQETVVTEVVTQSEETPKIVHTEPRHIPKLKPVKPLPRADEICPPKAGETEQQQVIRKLDCLLERNGN